MSIQFNYFENFKAKNKDKKNLNSLLFEERKNIYLKYINILSPLEKLLQEIISKCLTLNIPEKYKLILKEEYEYIQAIQKKFDLEIYLNAQKEYNNPLDSFEDLAENVEDLHEKLELTTWIIELLHKFRYSEIASELSNRSSKLFKSANELRVDVIKKSSYKEPEVVLDGLEGLDTSIMLSIEKVVFK